MPLILDPTVIASPLIALKVFNTLRYLVETAITDELFSTVNVDPDTLRASLGAPVVAGEYSFAANETEVSLEPSSNKRTAFASQQVDFIFWELILSFSRWTLTQGFDALVCSQSSIPSDPVNGQPQINIEIQSIEYDHPPIFDAENGSRVKYVFAIRPLRA